MLTTIKVKGMSCSHCVMAVKKALGAIEGVASVDVDLPMGMATIEHERPIEEGLLKGCIENAGYEFG